MASDLTLREVMQIDLPIFFAFETDPEATYMAAFGAKNPMDHHAFEERWNRILNDKDVVARTILRDGHVVGSIGSFIDKEFGKREVTYWIGKEYWGKGIATRALSQFLTELEVRPLYARASKDNAASIRVLEKCGFKIIGYGKGFANARGKEVEEAILELAEDKSAK